MSSPSEDQANPSAFFAYPSRPPMIRGTIRRASDSLRGGEVNTVTWEDLGEVGRGPIIINDILEAIDGSSVSVFEVTHLNQNVMFELGYAIGRDRHVWLLRDPTYEDAQKAWKEFQVLTGVRYTSYVNSDQVVGGFWKEQPWDKEETVFSRLVGSSLQPRPVGSLFFIRSRHDTDADRELARRVEEHRRAGIPVVVADPSESAAQPLSWYAQQIYGAAAVLVHLSGPGRIGADVHNARCALVAGMARGMGIPVLMIAEANFLAPLDYQDLLQVYADTNEALEKADGWLARYLEAVAEALKRGAAVRTRLRLATELSNLMLGEPVAEMEEDWLQDYFVPTAAFHEVVSPSTTLFVGRKGTGKTASLFRAGQVLREDKRNLVCLIKPASYELESLVRLLARYTERDAKGYLVEALWKFLLTSEIALSAYRRIQDAPGPPQHGTPEYDFSEFMQANPFLLADFAVRLEQAVDAVLLRTPTSGVGAERSAISEELHLGILRTLHQRLDPVLRDRERVAVLIDNLDKAWEKTADINQLAHLLLGLLAAVGPVSRDLTRGDRRRRPLRFSLAVFLRTDIYETVARVAREPDRIPVARLVWTDRDLLLRVIEDRYRAARNDEVEGGELWDKFFVPVVDGVPVRDYVVSRILPRPRDLVFFCNAAIGAAVNRGHSIVEVQDIRDAEQTYGAFALDAIKVENGVSAQQVEDVLYEFVGSQPTLTVDEVLERVRRVIPGEDAARQTVDHLRSLTFLGIETAPSAFSFAEDPLERRRDEGLLRGFEQRHGRPPRLQVHPAFRPYLEITDEAV